MISKDYLKFHARERLKGLFDDYMHLMRRQVLGTDEMLARFAATCEPCHEAIRAEVPEMKVGYDEAAKAPWVLAAAARGELSPLIATVLPLAEAALGHELVAAGELTGKVLLDPTLAV